MRMPSRVLARVAVVLAVASAVACGGAQESEKKGAAEPRSGGLSPDQVRVRVRANAEQLLACRERADAGKAKREVNGVATVGFTIASDGRVTDVRLVESTLEDPDVERCVVSVVERFSFPPSTAETVIARLPLTVGPPPAVDAGAPSPSADAGAAKPKR